MTGIPDALTEVGVTPVTPFSRDLSSVDRAGLVANLTHLVERGARLLYPAGNTGEVMSLSPEEWTLVVETAVETAGDGAAVVPGIAHELPVAIELARRAARIGADGLLLMPRIQPYASSEGLVEYWRRVAAAADLPVVVYRRGLPDDGWLSEVMQDDGVVGCKYAGTDLSRFAASVAADPSGAVWTCGVAERYAPFFWIAGAGGFTSGLANFAPRISLDLLQALRDRDLARAMQLRAACLGFEEIRARHADAFNVAAVKHAMDEVGLAGGAVRPPLRGVDPTTASEITGIAQVLAG